MSKIAVNEITDEVGTGAPTLPNGLGVTGDIDVSGKLTNGGTEGIEVDSSGRLLAPSQVSFNAVPPNTNITTVGKITVFTSTRHNVGNAYDTSNSTFTAPVSGRYLFALQMFTNAGSNARLDLRVNSASRLRCSRQYTASSYISLCGSIILDLSVNDSVDLDLNGGELHTNPSYSFFCGHFLG